MRSLRSACRRLTLVGRTPIMTRGGEEPAGATRMQGSHHPPKDATMTVTLDLPEELADRLRRKAAAEGKELDDYLRSLAEDAAPPEPAGSDPPHLALALAIAARLPSEEV